MNSLCYKYNSFQVLLRNNIQVLWFSFYLFNWAETKFSKKYIALSSREVTQSQNRKIQLLAIIYLKPTHPNAESRRVKIEKSTPSSVKCNGFVGQMHRIVKKSTSLYIDACAWVFFCQKQNRNHAPITVFSELGPYWLFLFPKLKTTMKWKHFATIEEKK